MSVDSDVDVAPQNATPTEVNEKVEPAEGKTREPRREVFWSEQNVSISELIGHEILLWVVKEYAYHVWIDHNAELNGRSEIASAMQILNDHRSSTVGSSAGDDRRHALELRYGWRGELRGSEGTSGVCWRRARGRTGGCVRGMANRLGWVRSRRECQG